MRKIFSVVCFVLLVIGAQAQTAASLTSWTVQPGVVNEAVQMAGAGIVGDYLFLIGGNRTADGDSNDVTRFYINPTTGLVDPGKIVSHRFPLAKIHDALAVMAKPERNKVVINP